MGTFIEQVQKNNQIQRSILTEKQQQRILKEKRLQEKERIKQEKEETILLKKEAIQHLDSYLEDVFIGIIKRKPYEKLNADYSSYLKNQLLFNKHEIINEIFSGAFEKEIINNLWFSAVNKKYKEAIIIEKIVNQNLEQQHQIELLKQKDYKKDLSEYRKQKNPLLNFKLDTLKNINISKIATIMIIPFIILFLVINCLFNLGIEESKKNNRW